MIRTLCFLLFLSALAPGAARAQQPSRPKAPPIPREMQETERAALTQAALALSRGQFDQAAAQIKPLLPPPAIQVWVDWAPVPRADRAAWRQAVQQAVHEWNLGLNGELRFQLTPQEEAADLRLFFDKNVAQIRLGQAQLVCSEERMETGGGSVLRRAAQARIALNVPYTEETHSAASIGHLAGQALGIYLGLAPSPNIEDLMGPDTHTQAVPLKPSGQNLQMVRQIQQARRQLLDYAARRVEVYLPKAVLTVDRSEIDAGDVQRGDNAHYVFNLKNTGDAPLEIEAKPNCGCTVANYDKVIPPGGEGKIEADMHTAGFRGRVLKLIDVSSNDLEKPKMSLHLLANVLSVVQVLPAETLVIPLKADGPTVKELEIRTAGKEPVEINRVTCGVPYAEAKLDPMPAGNGEGRAYKLTLTIRPEAPRGRSAFLVTAFTSSPREPQVNITAICDKGILAVPMSIFMGAITPSTVLPLTQYVTLMKSDGEFHLRKVVNDDPHLEIQQETLKEGAQYRLTVRYKGGWPTGMVRSKITVETDDPQQPRVEIPVLASVQTAAGVK
jgi:predicted Zn-dependent protease